MVKRTFDADGAGAGAATNQFWAYDEGINAVLQFDGPAASNLSHRYLWSDRVDELLADETVGGGADTLYALGDHLGTIRDIANFNESTSVTSVTNHRTYNSFGKLVSATNAAVDLIFGYTGKQLDDATGLQHNLFRWYDSALGQWLSEDPIGFAAGDENLKRYVGNASSMSTDPSGLIDPTTTVLQPEITSTYANGGWDLYGEVELNGYMVPSNWGGYVLSIPGAYAFWPLTGGGDLARPKATGPGILNIELDRKIRLNFEKQAIAGVTGTSRFNPDIPDTVLTATEAMVKLDIEFYGIATGMSQSAIVTLGGIPDDWLRARALVDDAGKKIPGQWLSTKDWVAERANDLLKQWKESGIGAGARSGQHGVPYNATARELREMAKDKKYLDEVRAELLRKAIEFEQRAREINHPMR